MLTISYIFHSSFLVETPKCRILFDFWKDPANRIRDIIFDNAKPTYILVSHFHKDHYNPEIFRWAAGRDHIRFIVSRDTAQRCRHFFSPTSTHNGPHLDQASLVVMQEGEVYADSIISVHAFGSSDIGNSYLVENGGRIIFHAGDLNAWVWEEDSDSEEGRNALSLFLQKIRYMKKSLGDETPIDIAFFPVDSRIGGEYWMGAKRFLLEFKVGFFLPMHLGLGDEEEQAKSRLDATCFNKYANPSVPTVFVGPLASYGGIAIPPGYISSPATGLQSL